jgi:hypothetical protein
MQGELSADFTAMPVGNMAVFFGGIATLLVVVAVVVVFLVRKLHIKSLGPIQMEQHNQTTLFSMNEVIKDIDYFGMWQMRQITSDMKIKISNIFTERRICTIARIALSSAIRFPLYESVANNHFTTELMPEHYDAYRARIVERMADEYISFSSVSNDLSCGKESLPSWTEVSKDLTDCIDLWLCRIGRETLLACQKKLGVYNSYLHNFKENKDAYRMDIVQQCIDKNRRYADVLKTRIGSALAQG